MRAMCSREECQTPRVGRLRQICEGWDLSCLKEECLIPWGQLSAHLPSSHTEGMQKGLSLPWTTVSPTL